MKMTESQKKLFKISNITFLFIYGSIFGCIFGLMLWQVALCAGILMLIVKFRMIRPKIRVIVLICEIIDIFLLLLITETNLLSFIPHISELVLHVRGLLEVTPNRGGVVFLSLIFVFLAFYYIMLFKGKLTDKCDVDASIRNLA
jgi:hypothetical protein